MKRFLGVLVVLVLLLAGLVVGGAYVFDDRIRSTVEDRVAVELQRSVPFATRPTVGIEGEPLALHLVTREFPSVNVRAREMPVQAAQGTTIPLYDVDFTLTGVRYETGAVHAASLTGGGWLDYADLAAVAGARIQPTEDGRLALERDVEFLGVAFTGRLVGRAALDRATQTITLTDTELDLAGVAIPPDATQALVDAILQPIPVALPYGLQLSALEPGEQGLDVVVDATDVTFPTR